MYLSNMWLCFDINIGLLPVIEYTLCDQECSLV